MNDDQQESTRLEFIGLRKQAAAQGSVTVETGVGSGELLGREVDRDSDGGSAPKEADEEVAEDRRLAILRANVAIRYFNARRAWFEGLAFWSAFLPALTGSGAFIALLTQGQGASQGVSLSVVLGGLTAFFGAINVATRPAERARAMHDLVKRHADLLADLERQVEINRQAMGEFEARNALIQAEEPPHLSALMVICQNAEYGSRGYDYEDLHFVSLIQRVCAQTGSFPRPTHWEKNEVRRLRLRKARRLRRHWWRQLRRDLRNQRLIDRGR